MLTTNETMCGPCPALTVAVINQRRPECMLTVDRRPWQPSMFSVGRYLVNAFDGVLLQTYTKELRELANTFERVTMW